MMGLLEGALRVVLVTFVLLLIAILLWFLFNALMRVFNGPTLGYGEIAIVVAIVSVAVGNWGFSLLRRTATTSA